MIGVYLTILRLSGEAIGQRPLLFLGVLLIVVGVQLLTLGLLGQMLVLNRREVGGTDLERGRVDRFLQPLPKRQEAGGEEAVTSNVQEA